MCDRTYTVTIDVNVTADDPAQAARFALEDLRDRSLASWEFTVLDDATGIYTNETVEA